MPKKGQLVAVDMGSYSVKVAEIESGKDGLILKTFGMAIFSPDVIVEGQIQDKAKASETIKNLFTHLNIKNKNVCSAISGVSCILKKLPPMQSKTIEQIEEGLKGEMEQYIPYDIAEVYIDHFVQTSGGEIPKPGVVLSEAEVVVAAAPKALVDSYVEVLEAADLNPVIMDIGILAIQNAVEATVPELPGQYIIVNLGSECLSIHAVKGNVPIFTRDTVMGGGQLTRAIMANFDLTYFEAEAVKLGNRGVQPGKEGLLKKIFTDYVTEWTKEVSRAVEYLRYTFPEITMTTIYLTGGTSKLPGIKDAITLETRMNVIPVNPFQGLLVDSRRFDEEYLNLYAPESTQVVGMALRQAGDK